MKTEVDINPALKAALDVYCGFHRITFDKAVNEFLTASLNEVMDVGLYELTTSADANTTIRYIHMDGMKDEYIFAFDSYWHALHASPDVRMAGSDALTGKLVEFGRDDIISVDLVEVGGSRVAWWNENTKRWVKAGGDNVPVEKVLSHWRPVRIRLLCAIPDNNDRDISDRDEIEQLGYTIVRRDW